MLTTNYQKERYAQLSPINKALRQKKDEARYGVPIVSLKKEITHFFKLKLPDKAERIVRDIVDEPAQIFNSLSPLKDSRMEVFVQ